MSAQSAAQAVMKKRGPVTRRNPGTRHKRPRHARPTPAALEMPNASDQAGSEAVPRHPYAPGPSQPVVPGPCPAPGAKHQTRSVATWTFQAGTEPPTPHFSAVRHLLPDRLVSVRPSSHLIYFVYIGYCVFWCDDASDTIDQTPDIVDQACETLLAEVLERQGVTEGISFPDFRDADSDVQTSPDMSDEAIVASVVEVSPNDSDEDDTENDSTGDSGPTVAEAAHCVSVMRVFAEKRGAGGTAGSQHK
ncbi:hypothetical protein MTO96_035312 [Rhipicephalus appendiculatus]